MTGPAFCSTCGAARAPGAAFCATCGTRFEQSGPAVPTANQAFARGAIVGQNYQFLVLIAMGLGFVAGVIIGAYVFVPVGGWGAVLGLACPIIGLVVGPRLLFILMAR
jgi:hypothetical protein